MSRSRKPVNKESPSYPSREGLANTLMATRKFRGLLQKDVAHLSALKQSRVSEVECMGGNPTLETLDAIGRVLGLKLVYVPR